MIFLGSEAGSKAYQVFYPVSNRVQSAPCVQQRQVD